MFETQDDRKVLFDAATTPIYRVLDDEGVNMGNAQVRQVGEHWICVDDENGYHWIDGRDIGFWNLEKEGK